MLKICFLKNVENHATFVEGFWPEFYTHGRFMKYSMSGYLIYGQNKNFRGLLLKLLVVRINEVFLIPSMKSGKSALYNERLVGWGKKAISGHPVHLKLP